MAETFNQINKKNTNKFRCVGCVLNKLGVHINQSLTSWPNVFESKVIYLSFKIRCFTEGKKGSLLSYSLEPLNE